MAPQKSSNPRAFDRKRYGVFEKSLSRGIEPHWQYFALFRLLQLSESYWLAHREVNAGLTTKEQRPSDFAAVRRTYKLFGDVWATPFWTWWNSGAYEAFGRIETAGPVRLLGQLKDATLATSGEKPREKKTDLLGDAALIVAIPIGMSRREMHAQIDELLDSQTEPRAAYPIVPTKTRRATLNMAIRIVQARAHFPTSYVAGNRSRIARMLETDDDPKSGYSAKRQEMTEYASKLSRRAFLWAENAARGSFPSLERPKPHEFWPAFDYEGLKRRLSTYVTESTDALSAIPEQDRTSEKRYAGRNRTIRWD